MFRGLAIQLRQKARRTTTIARSVGWQTTTLVIVTALARSARWNNNNNNNNNTTTTTRSWPRNPPAGGTSVGPAPTHAADGRGGDVFNRRPAASINVLERSWDRPSSSIDRRARTLAGTFTLAKHEVLYSRDSRRGSRRCWRNCATLPQFARHCVQTVFHQRLTRSRTLNTADLLPLESNDASSREIPAARRYSARGDSRESQFPKHIATRTP